MREAKGKNVSLRPRRADWLLLGGILTAALLCCLGLYLFSPRGAFAVVTVDGQEALRLPLDRDCTETVTTVYGTHTVIVEDGTVRVAEAPCKNQICVHHAPVSRGGETIVCLPCVVVVTVLEDGDTLLTPSGEEAAP